MSKYTSKVLLTKFWTAAMLFFNFSVEFKYWSLTHFHPDLHCAWFFNNNNIDVEDSISVFISADADKMFFIYFEDTYHGFIEDRC